MRRVLSIPAVLVCLLGLVVPLHAQGERLSVGVREANVRSGPGDSNPVLWRVELYHPFEVTERKGGWCRVKDSDGEYGWISASLLVPEKTVITLKDGAQARLGPGPETRVLFRAEKGVAFKVLDRAGAWVKVRHRDGETGWMNESLLW